MVVSRKRRRAEKRRRATAGAGMHRGVFGEVTGASRELRRCSHCAGEEGHKGNFKSEPSLSVPAPFASPNFPPLVLPYPYFSQTHMSNLSVLHTNTALPLQTQSQLSLSVSITHEKFITGKKLIVTPGILM